MPGKANKAPPGHPGVVIFRILKEHQNTQEQLARAMDVSLLSVNQLCNGWRNITPAMAIRLSIVLQPTTPEYWLELQQGYDLKEATRMHPEIADLQPLIRITDDEGNIPA